MYSLLDRKMKAFHGLMTDVNDEIARRHFVDELRSGDTLVTRYPADFDLFCVGEFDDASGVLVGSPPRLVANVGDLLEASNGVRQAAQR